MTSRLSVVMTAAPFVFALMLGCNSEPDRLPAYPATGKVLISGKPLPNAQIVLHPLDKSDARHLPAQASTDSEGTFSLTTYETGDGAIAGEYIVTVAKYEPVNRGNGLEPGPNILPPQFSERDKSKLRVTIASGQNVLDPVEVRR